MDFSISPMPRTTTYGITSLFVAAERGVFVLFFPYKIEIYRLSAVDEDILSCAEFVCNSEKICPFGNFLCTCPPFKRCFVHYLSPQLGIVHNTLIKRCYNSARVKAVTNSTVLCHTQGNVFCIRQYSALACTVFGKFRTCMRTCRAYIQN